MFWCSFCERIESCFLSVFLSKNKIEQLRLIISKLGFIIKNIEIPELQELNDLIADYGSIVNYEAWENWKDIIDKNLDFIDLNPFLLCIQHLLLYVVFLLWDILKIFSQD